MTKEFPIDSPVAKKVFRDALEGFVRTLCERLRAKDARALALSVSAFDGLIVFSDNSGGIGFEVQVTFREPMTYPETLALVGALTEKNGPGGPVTYAGDPVAAAEMLKKVQS